MNNLIIVTTPWGRYAVHKNWMVPLHKLPNWSKTRGKD